MNRLIFLSVSLLAGCMATGVIAFNSSSIADEVSSTDYIFSNGNLEHLVSRSGYVQNNNESLQEIAQVTSGELFGNNVTSNEEFTHSSNVTSIDRGVLNSLEPANSYQVAQNSLVRKVREAPEFSEEDPPYFSHDDCTILKRGYENPSLSEADPSSYGQAVYYYNLLQEQLNRDNRVGQHCSMHHLYSPSIILSIISEGVNENEGDGQPNGDCWIVRGRYDAPQGATEIEEIGRVPTDSEFVNNHCPLSFRGHI